MRRDTNMRVGSNTKMHPDASRKEAIRAFYAMREELARAEAERDELKKRIEKMDKQVEIQCSDGNWNYDPYMHGMANGLLVAQATMHDLHDFTGPSAPDKWLCDREAPTPTEAAA